MIEPTTIAKEVLSESPSKTHKPARPKNIINAIMPWKVRALNDASAPIASKSVPNNPSNTSAVIPPIIINANHNKKRMPPNTAEDAKISSNPPPPS